MRRGDLERRNSDHEHKLEEETHVAKEHVVFGVADDHNRADGF